MAVIVTQARKSGIYDFAIFIVAEKLNFVGVINGPASIRIMKIINPEDLPCGEH